MLGIGGEGCRFAEFRVFVRIRLLGCQRLGLRLVDGLRLWEVRFSGRLLSPTKTPQDKEKRWKQTIGLEIGEVGMIPALRLYGV